MTNVHQDERSNKIVYKGKEVGNIFKIGSTFYFNVKTKRTHLVRELNASNIQKAVEECGKICQELENKARK